MYVEIGEDKQCEAKMAASSSGGVAINAAVPALLATLEAALDARFPPSTEDGHLEAQLIRYTL